MLVDRIKEEAVILTELHRDKPVSRFEEKPLVSGDTEQALLRYRTGKT